MIEKILLPMLGETMDEATIATWHKAEGDRVSKGDVVLEITTDKATLEVEAYAEGTLRKILAPEGMLVAVNEPIAVLADPDEEVPEDVLSYVPKAAEKKEAPKAVAPAGGGDATRTRPDKVAPQPTVASPQLRPAASPAASAPPPYQVPQAPMAGSRLAASPRAKRVARERDLGWRFLVGSGPDGRIRERDVLAYERSIAGLDATHAAKRLAADRHVDLRDVAGTGPGGRITEADVEKAEPALPAGGFERREMTPMRRVIAERMAWSALNIPQFSLTVSVDMTAAGELRERFEAEGAKISYTDVIVKAAALALRDHPDVAALFDEWTIIRRAGLHVGIAVALEEGLIVPVVRSADRKSLADVSAEIKDLAERARANRLTPDEYTGGVITISNLGMLGIDEFRAIVNPGESAIVACGTISQTPVVRDGEVTVRPILKVTGSFDHRVVDGASGARYLAQVKELLEAAEGLV